VLDVDLLACPACGGALRADLACRACGEVYDSPLGVPCLRSSKCDARTDEVRAFYTESPFPNYPPDETLSTLRRKAERSELARLLDLAIPGDASVVEIGCGTGQMSLFLARAERRVVAADLTRASLELGREAADRLGVDGVTFVETDLRTPGLKPGAFDVVYSSGVLHHTPDPRASFEAIARLAKPGGFVIVGLYNAYARILHRLRRLFARATGVYAFDPVLRDRRAEPARREAWLRDQYLHPLEHRHTVREVRAWFDENGIEWIRTYPSSLVSEDAPADLFVPAEDDWGPEALLAQLAWTRSLWAEGGLFVAVGRRITRARTS
jgi:SAM-dependent methyltransferase